MTTEQKAKAYDEAIEMARKINSGEGVEAPPDWTICEVIFPELKESEDEKIRKAIKEAVNYYWEDDTQARTDILAWLEKQSKHKHSWSEEDERLRKTTIAFLKDFAEQGYENAVECIDWLKTQGDKPQGKSALEATKEEVVDNANKVEPKFKVGDWIVNNISKDTFLIKSINNGYLTLEDTNGNKYSPCLPSIEDDYRLWSIKDAKDGDVLYLQHDGKEHIIIYKGIIKERFRTFVSAYCAYNGIVDAFCFADVSKYGDIAYGVIMPATKEQCDELEKAITDAGYIWDYEKKELRKIEQKSVDKVEPKFHFSVGQWIVATGKCIYFITKIDGFNVTLINVDGDEYVSDTSSLDDAHLWSIKDAKDGDVLVCPKYAGDIIPNIFIFKDIKTKDNDVFCYCSFSKTFETEGYIANADPINTDFYPATKEQRETLMKTMADAGYTFDFEKKELKKIHVIDEGKSEMDYCFTKMMNGEKVSPAWSEEDEHRTKDAIYFLETAKVHYASTIELDACIDWLKSLKDRVQPQNTWKPSDDQIGAIRLARSFVVDDFAEHPTLSEILMELEEQLKRLKG